MENFSRIDIKGQDLGEKSLSPIDFGASLASSVSRDFSMELSDQVKLMGEFGFNVSGSGNGYQEESVSMRDLLEIFLAYECDPAVIEKLKLRVMTLSEGHGEWYRSKMLNKIAYAERAGLLAEMKNDPPHDAFAADFMARLVPMGPKEREAVHLCSIKNKIEREDAYFIPEFLSQDAIQMSSIVGVDVESLAKRLIKAKEGLLVKQLWVNPPSHLPADPDDKDVLRGSIKIPSISCRIMFAYDQTREAIFSTVSSCIQTMLDSGGVNKDVFDEGYCVQLLLSIAGVDKKDLWSLDELPSDFSKHPEYSGSHLQQDAKALAAMVA